MDKIIKQGLQITAGLDPASQKEMRMALRNIFTDEAHIDFNNPENIKGLKAFASLFRNMFEQVGNKKFDFNKMIELPGPEMFKGLTDAAKEFEGVWSSIASQLGNGGLKNVFMRDASDLSMALERITNAQGNIIKRKSDQMKNAFKPVKSPDINWLLEEANSLKREFVDSKHWEEQTTAALKYLNVYERIMSLTMGDVDDAKKRGMRIDLKNVFDELENIGPYTVQQIESAKPQIQASLQNLFNLKNGKPLIGVTEGGAVDINVAPKLIKTLDVGDLTGGKKTVTVPIDLDFKDQLDKLRDLYAKSFDSQEADAEFEKMKQKMVEGLPLDVQEKAMDRLLDFADKFSEVSNVANRSYNAIWKDFVGYGLPVGTGTGTGTGNGTGTTPDNGVTSGEVTELEAVRKKVAEVTQAVKTKNEAFLAEQKVVKKVAQSEIQSLGEIEKKVASVKTAIANIYTKANTVHTPNVNTEAFKQEGQAAEGAISQEMGSLTKLRAALQLTTKRINEKTTAFETEKNVVNTVVNSEINALSRLNTKVTDVNKTVMTLLQNIQNAQSSVPNIPIPQAQPTPQNNTGAQGQGSSGGGKTSPQLLNAKIDTQFSSLSLMYAQLESVGKLTPQIEQMWLQLWDSLSKVNDASSLQLWREELKQVGNAMKEIMIANNLVEKEGVQSFKALIDITKLYNKMAIGAAGAKTPEEKDFYTQEANAALIEQQRILQGITLTQKEQVQYDKLEAQRKREINKIQASQAGAENAKRQKQEEAIVVRELVELYEQLGRARAQGDYTAVGAIRGQIKAERGKLSAVDRATDDKFAQATARGEQSVVDEINKAATKAQNDSLRERQKILGDLIRLHRELGVLEEKEKSSSVNDSKRQQYKKEIYDLYKQISAKEQLLILTREEIDLLNRTHYDSGRSARISNAGERESEINKLKGQYAKLGEAQANAEHKGTNGAKERFAILAKEIAQKKTSLQLTQQELDMLRKIVAESYKNQSGILLKEQQDDEFKQQIKDAQKQAGVGKAQSVESRAIDTFAQASVLPGVTPEVQNSLNEYQSKIQALRSEINSFPTDRVATDAEKNRLIQARLEVDAYTKEIQELIANYERLSGENATVLGKSSLGLGASADAYKQELTQTIMAQTQGRASIKSYDAATNTLTYTLKTGRGEFTQYTASVRQTDGALVSVQGTTTRAMGVFESIGKKIKEYSYYFTGSMMVYRVIAWVREGVTVVKEIDSALTELKKVTDETEESYDRFLDTAAKTAEKVGSTIKDVVSSTADWARLGYSMKEAHQMATSTQILMNVSEFDDVSKATDTLISAVQAFKYTAEESMDVVDILNTIGKQICRGYIVIYNRAVA